MSAARFKSRDDYFSKQSGLTKKVIKVKPKKSRKQPKIADSLPPLLFVSVFCQSSDRFEIDGEGRYTKADYDLSRAVQRHLDGEITLLVDPISDLGKTLWITVSFDLSDTMQHPFAKLNEYAKAMNDFNMPTCTEVTDGGKGHYRLWIFFENPIDVNKSSDSLKKLGMKLFGTAPVVFPDNGGITYSPMPLQGEMLLLQRGVYVNNVGKMIRNQTHVLEKIERCSLSDFHYFV